MCCSYFDGFVQGCSEIALGKLESCTKPSIYSCLILDINNIDSNGPFSLTKLIDIGTLVTTYICIHSVYLHIHAIISTAVYLKAER